MIGPYGERTDFGDVFEMSAKWVRKFLALQAASTKSIFNKPAIKLKRGWKAAMIV